MHMVHICTGVLRAVVGVAAPVLLLVWLPLPGVGHSLPDVRRGDDSHVTCGVTCDDVSCDM